MKNEWTLIERSLFCREWAIYHWRVCERSLKITQRKRLNKFRCGTFERKKKKKKEKEVKQKRLIELRWLEIGGILSKRVNMCGSSSSRLHFVNWDAGKSEPTNFDSEQEITANFLPTQTLKVLIMICCAVGFGYSSSDAKQSLAEREGGKKVLDSFWNFHFYYIQYLSYFQFRWKDQTENIRRIEFVFFSSSGK